METHAHHLHKTPGHGWKHYLFEFLMLFLAVTLGFFVENKRENYTEQKRGQEYLRSFTQDLITDTTRFANLISIYAEKIVFLNNLNDCYDSVTGKMHSDSCLFKITGFSFGFPDLVYTDRTLQQLKNAGGLRLLDSRDADSISSYDNLLRAAEKNETTEVQETQTLLRGLAYELIDFGTTLNLGPSHSNKLHKNQSFIFGNNLTLLNKFFNVLRAYWFEMRNEEQIIQHLKDEATGLIKYFKNK